jgi:hypothetical protein
MTTTPADVAVLITDWMRAGRPAQQPIGWKRDRWLAGQGDQVRYPELSRFEGFLRSLPNPIGREHVRDIARSATKGEDEALEAFVASMVWGFGGTGYAAFRTNRILAVNSDAGERLRDVAQIVATDGPVEGYRALSKDRWLKWLGPAFGTKYLHFCSDPERPALVLDALVATWLNEFGGGIRLRPARWSTTQYATYLDAMTAWSAGACAPTDLEMLVFVAEATRRNGNQWAAPPEALT